MSRLHNASLPSPTDESDLMLRAHRGDRAAYGQIVLLYQDRLFTALLRLVGGAEEAAELARQTFRAGLKKIVEYDGRVQPYPWLLSIGMNLGLKSLHRSRQPRRFTMESADGADDAARQRRQMQETVLEAMGRLHGEHRVLLILRDIEGFDHDGMADALDLPLATIKGRLLRARLALREQLRDALQTWQPMAEDHE
jgi:RNA polymerase sigma-70 factor, ECF subfamily